jgi:hypothetical protein
METVKVTLENQDGRKITINFKQDHPGSDFEINCNFGKEGLPKNANGLDIMVMNIIMEPFTDPNF